MTCRILDPSCGSGIFLVDSFRRMVEKRLNGEFYTDDNELLCEILKNNIYGIDLNPVAVDVAIFSLYLAALDYKDPKSLKDFKLPNLKNENLFVCDFFDDIALNSLNGISFDFIIGNPPWSSKYGMHMEYCKARKYDKYMQDKDTCRSFIFRSEDFSTSNTQCCFVLHSKKMLYVQGEKSINFRKEYLLKKTEIIRLVELSSVRKLVFKSAKAPAIILTYRFTDKDASENRFEYISLKPNIFFKLFNIVVVEKTDVKHVKQSFLTKYDWAWKTIVYGFFGDVDIIAALKSEYQTLGDHLKSTALVSGTGVQCNDGENDAVHLYGFPLLDSKDSIDHFEINLEKLETLRKQRINRPRNPSLFSAPYCLVLKGIDLADYTMRAVYSEESFVFKETVYAIKGSNEQKPELLNIVGLLNSKTYAYLNLMLGSSLGIEREQRHTKEVLSFPYIYSEIVSKQVEKVQEIKTRNKDLMMIQKEDVSGEIDTLNRLIFDAFGLTENEFLDYALRIQIPQLSKACDNKKAKDTDAYRSVTNEDFEIYGKYFYDYFSNIYSKTEKHIQLFAYPNVARHYCAFEVIVQNTKPGKWLQIIDVGNDRHTALTSFSSHKINDIFYQLKDVLYFEDSSFFIIKPNHYKNWHPAIAKLDLMEVVDKILSRDKGDI